MSEINGVTGKNADLEVIRYDSSPIKADVSNIFQGPKAFLKALDKKMNRIVEDVAFGRPMEIDGIQIKDPTDPGMQLLINERINDWIEVGKMVQNRSKGLEEVEKALDRLIG